MTISKEHQKPPDQLSLASLSFHSQMEICYEAESTGVTGESRTLAWGRAAPTRGLRETAEPEPIFCLYSTHPVAVITDFDDRFILPEIPHDCLAAGVSRRQNVLNLTVPRECLDVFWGLLRQDVWGAG